MPGPTDEVVVLYQDLEIVLNALRNAEDFIAAYDAVLAARDLKYQRSKLRNNVHRATQRVEGIVQGLNEEPDDE